MALASHSVKDDGGSIICNHHIAGDNIVEEKCSLVSGRILKSRDNLRNQTDSNVTKVLHKDVSVAMNIRKRGNENMKKSEEEDPVRLRIPMLQGDKLVLLFSTVRMKGRKYAGSLRILRMVQTWSKSWP